MKRILPMTLIIEALILAGWWKYDERSNVDLESAYNSNETECLLLLAGTLYCVDFQNMVQFRRSDPTKRRRVKRDIPTLPSKGIAGIKIIDTRQTDEVENTSDINNDNTENRENETILVVNVGVNGISDVSAVVQPVPDMDDLTDRLRALMEGIFNRLQKSTVGESTGRKYMIASNINLQRAQLPSSDEDVGLQGSAEDE